MFHMDHYEELKLAIGNMTRDEETGKIKNGLKLTLNYLVKDVCDSMHVFYLKKKANQKAADIGNYMFVASLGHLFFLKMLRNQLLQKG